MLVMYPHKFCDAHFGVGGQIYGVYFFECCCAVCSGFMGLLWEFDCILGAHKKAHTTVLLRGALAGANYLHAQLVHYSLFAIIRASQKKIYVKMGFKQPCAFQQSDENTRVEKPSLTQPKRVYWKFNVRTFDERDFRKGSLNANGLLVDSRADDVN